MEIREISRMEIRNMMDNQGDINRLYMKNARWGAGRRIDYCQMQTED